MNYLFEDLGKALKAARKAGSLSQRELSIKVGIPQSHISKIEKGLVDLRLSTLIGLARSLELEPILVPRKIVPALGSLMDPEAKVESRRPAYSLDDEDDA